MEFENYKNFGRCAKFEANGIKVLVTVEIGPRIIYFGDDKVNFMNEDIDRNVSKSGDYFDKTYHAGEAWYLYGGHRVWKAPEDMETYVTDNYDVDWFTHDGTTTFMTKTTKFGLSYGFSLQQNKDGSLNIVNIIKNYNAARDLSLWSLTVMAKGGKLFVRQNTTDNMLQPSKNLVMWPYNDFNDERFNYGKEVITLSQTDKAEAFKFGTKSNENVAYYELLGKMLKISYEKKEGTFGDFDSNFESYTNAHILEIEALDAIRTIETGETLTMCEKWEILDSNDKEFIEIKKQAEL